MEQQKNRNSSQQLDNPSSDTIPSFLLKTYDILENQKYIDIICWTKNGQGFIVKNVKEFSESVLPIYFRHSNYTSFVRQLNMYDFHKTRQQNHQNAFKNIMFKKGFRHLLKDIQRKDYKKNKDSNKQTTRNEKMSVEKSKEIVKNDKPYELVNDIGKQSLKKLNQINNSLEKKALILVELRQLPTKQPEILKLLDVLFDAKKFHKEVVNKLDQLCNCFNNPAQKLPIDFISFKLSSSSSQKLEQNAQCPTTDPKATHLDLSKEEAPIPTHCSLFSSFNQI